MDCGPIKGVWDMPLIVRLQSITKPFYCILLHFTVLQNEIWWKCLY